jgi:hypothetical protein
MHDQGKQIEEAANWFLGQNFEKKNGKTWLAEYVSASEMWT